MTAAAWFLFGFLAGAVAVVIALLVVALAGDPGAALRDRAQAAEWEHR